MCVFTEGDLHPSWASHLHIAFPCSAVWFSVTTLVNFMYNYLCVLNARIISSFYDQVFHCNNNIHSEPIEHLIFSLCVLSCRKCCCPVASLLIRKKIKVSRHSNEVFQLSLVLALFRIVLFFRTFLHSTLPQLSRGVTPSFCFLQRLVGKIGNVIRIEF